MATILTPGYLYWNGTAYVLTDVTSTLVGPAGGDLTGAYPNPTVLGIQGNPISSASPSSGQVLQWNGSVWEPGTVSSFTAGGDLSGSGSDQTVIGIQGNPVSATSPTSNQVLSWSGTNWAPTSLSTMAMGDVTGYLASNTVVKIQNHAIEAYPLGSNEDGYVLTWNNGMMRWRAEPSEGGGGGGFTAGGDLTGTSTDQTVISAQNGLLVFDASTGLIDISAAATGAGVFQEVAASDVAPNNLIITAQGAYLGAATNVQGANLILTAGPGATTNGVSGNVVLQIGTPTGSGGDSYGLVNVGSYNYVAMGTLAGYAPNYAGIWLNNGLTPLFPTNFWNANLFTYGGTTFVQAPNSIVLTLASSNKISVNATEVDFHDNISVGNIGSANFNGAAGGAIYLNNVGTNPSGLVTTGSLILSSTTGNLILGATAALAGDNAAGNINLLYGAPTGAGLEAYVKVSRANTSMWQLGAQIGSTSTSAMYGNVTPSSTNYAFSTTGSGTVINATSEVALAIGDSAQMEVYSSTIAFTPAGTPTAFFNGGSGECTFGYNVAVGAYSGGNYGGGAGGCLFLNNVGTDPSTNPTGGGVLYADSGNLYWIGTSGPAVELNNTGSFAAGGDLTGTSTDQTVNAIQGVVITGSAFDGAVLSATSSSTATWNALPLYVFSVAMVDDPGNSQAGISTGQAIQFVDGGLTAPFSSGLYGNGMAGEFGPSMIINSTDFIATVGYGNAEFLPLTGQTVQVGPNQSVVICGDGTNVFMAGTTPRPVIVNVGNTPYQIIEPSGTVYFVDTSGGACTIYTPIYPQDGQTFTVKDSTGSWGTNSLTIDDNESNSIENPYSFSITPPYFVGSGTYTSFPASIDLSTVGNSITFTYSLAELTWLITTQLLPD